MVYTSFTLPMEIMYEQLHSLFFLLHNISQENVGQNLNVIHRRLAEYTIVNPYNGVQWCHRNTSIRTFVNYYNFQNTLSNDKRQDMSPFV